MELGEVILAQTAAAVGVPVLLPRTPPPSTDPRLLHELYLAQSTRGAELVDGVAGPDGRRDVPEGSVLALNFHDVPAEHRPVVREQLRRVADLGPNLLDDPGTSAGSVLVVFYDGYREAGLFGAEECERLGIRALFLPVFTSSHPAWTGLTPDELAAVAAVHPLGFHTDSHRSGEEIDVASLEDEVHEPVRRLTAAAGTAPLFGAYRGGGRFDPGRPADRVLQELGVRWWLSNWSLEPVPDAG
ncbi:polysaccharide deacetylase family protein [Auraticoccus monumenti]|uniref:Polysaccharide deacetylase n=1 Tax=Auraticoccus monumenti TaxID=675864 RepID=A0A1G6YX61_9ACTN|nr:hypothetical protein [Auraticoccus monumenti]SDD94176.1 hypothetical protein SAMN04489747_2106 [Auraticoccus monumenti]